MTPEQQRIAIAEARGWTNASWSIHFGLRAVVPESQGFHLEQIPDYLYDLNACHEMEKNIPEGQFRKYASELMDVCGNHPVGCIPDYPEDLLRLFHLVHATATQRAEAFLRTIGKWSPSPHQPGSDK